MNILISILGKFLFRIRKFIKYLLHYQQFDELKKRKITLPSDIDTYTFAPYIKYKCIFIHIPKTAGISLSYSLFGRQTGGHVTVSEYQVIFNKKEFDSFFKFAFVRNPWDRVASAYFYLINGGMNTWDFQWAKNNISNFNSFENFVVNWLNKKNNIFKIKHFWPQYKFIFIPGIKKPQVNFIGYYENIEEDYEYIKKKLHLGNSLILMNKTYSKQYDYRYYYNDNTREIVNNIYIKDISYFGYDFENKNINRFTINNNSL